MLLYSYLMPILPVYITLLIKYLWIHEPQINISKYDNIHVVSRHHDWPSGSFCHFRQVFTNFLAIYNCFTMLYMANWLICQLRGNPNFDLLHSKHYLAWIVPISHSYLYKYLYNWLTHIYCRPGPLCQTGFGSQG